MKKVLFIGGTVINFKNREQVSHLEKKYGGLNQGIKTFVLGRGNPFYKKVWGTEFHLLPSGFLFWPLALFSAFYLCLTKKIDVVAVQSPLVEGLVGTILKKVLGKELIVEIHGDWKEGPFLSRRRKFEAVEKKIVPFLAKLSLRGADKIRVISSFTKNEALKISGQKPYLLFPTFTDIDSFLKEKEVFSENFILFVGVLSPLKNVNILVDSFSKIEKEFPHFRLVIIGEGVERKNLESQVKSLGLESKVEFKGRLSLEKTKNVMKKCYCLVLPSESEGLGRVLMEAMALQKPVIGSNVGGIPDLVKKNKNGFLVEAGNRLELAGRLRILLKNRNIAVKMGQEGRKFIESNFSNKKYIQNYISLINM